MSELVVHSHFFGIQGEGCGVLYRCDWVSVTLIPAIPRLTRWHKQCLESGSEKATRTRYQFQVTFSDWLSEHSSGARLQPWVHPALGPAALGPGQPGAANLCLVQPGPKPRALFLDYCPIFLATCQWPLVAGEYYYYCHIIKELKGIYRISGCNFEQILP